MLNVASTMLSSIIGVEIVAKFKGDPEADVKVSNYVPLTALDNDKHVALVFAVAAIVVYMACR